MQSGPGEPLLTPRSRLRRLAGMLPRIATTRAVHSGSPVTPEDGSVIVRSETIAQPSVLVRRLLLFAAIVAVFFSRGVEAVGQQGPSPALGEHAAAPAPARGGQFPWPYLLRLQHDKPLVVEGYVLDSAGELPVFL